MSKKSSATSQMSAFLTKASKQLSSSLDYEKTLKRIGRLIVPHLADWFSIDILDDNDSPHLLTVHHKDPEKVKWAWELRKKTPVDMDASTGMPHVIRTGKSEIYPDIPDRLLVSVAKNKQELDLLRKIGFKSVMIVPLIVFNKVRGVITFVNTNESGRNYNEEDLDIAEDFSRIVAMALENTRLYTESQESKSRFFNLFNGIDDAVLVIDQNGNYIDANPAASRLLGYTKDELLSMQIGDLSTTDMGIQSQTTFNKLKKTGKWRAEGYIRKKDGSIVQVEARSTTIKIADQTVFTSVLRDITERKRTVQLNAQLAAIVESTDDAIIGKDLNGCITSWNKAAERIYGYKKSEVIGKKITILFPTDKKDEFDLIMKKIKKGESIDHFNTKRVKKDGTVIDAAITVSPIRNDEKQIIGASTIARDITEQIQQEKRKDEFLSIASHELKTPITSIKAFAQILQKYFDDKKNPTTSRYLERMNDQVDRLTKLVQDLLDVSKIQAGKLDYSEDVFNFETLIKETIEDMQAITKNHMIVYQGNADVMVLADKYRLSQVLINLISNAIKYSPQADKIVVTASYTDDSVNVAVQDFGIGIPKDKQPRIFNRFYRVLDPTRHNYPGLGLGLYISFEIVRRQKGNLWVESEEGKGSVFKFSLPITLHSKQKKNHIYASR